MTTPTRDEVIQMAREAGFMPTVLNHWPNELERFAAAAYARGAAAEREARQAAQAEISALQERLNRADSEKCAAVNAMREACLAECKTRLHAGDAGVLCVAKAIEKMGQQ